MTLGVQARGVRIIPPTDLQAVTPDARAKDHFVIVDAVGVCERDKTDSRPMDTKKSVPLDKLLQAVSLGNVEDDVLSSIAARLARLDASESRYRLLLDAHQLWPLDMDDGADGDHDHP